MILIDWRDDYCTGITGVDYEHEKMIEQINALFVSIDNKIDKRLLIESLGDIYGSISAHFALEEQMMQKHKYEHYEEHRADHQRLLNEIGDITESLENSNELDETLFKQKLADWFQSHFKTHDSRLHKLVHQSPHDRSDEPTLIKMVKDAKDKLLGKIRHPH
jgi:hemerythrin